MMENETKTCVSSISDETKQTAEAEKNEFVPVENEDEDKSAEELLAEMRERILPGYMDTFTMQKLYEKSFGTRTPIVEGLIYPGLYLFVGAPKTGKSFIMTQLAYHISCGKSLWGFSVQKNKVLYFALEDTEERLQNRIFRMFGDEVSDKLFFTVASSQISNGFNDQLDKFLRKNPDTKVIIIDTLQKIRDVGGDGYSYSGDYEIISNLKKFADEHKICMILVHHTRKQDAADKTEMISGTNGLFGAADGAFIMYKESRTSNNAIIEVTGRDQADQKLFIRRDPETLKFTLEHSDTQLWQEPPDEILESVASVLESEERTTWTGTATELKELLSLPLTANALSYHLNINSSRLADEYHIRYERGKTHGGRAIRLTKITEERTA